MKTAATERHPFRAATIVAVWLLSLVCTAGALAQEQEPAAEQAAAAPAGPRILAHGTENRVWAGLTATGKEGLQTWIQTREAGNPQWRTFARIERQVKDITHLGLELAVLLDNGEWRIYWDGSSRLGPPLPREYRLLAFAGGDSRDLFAIAQLQRPAAEAPATAPATSPSAATLPASQPAPPGFALFVLEQSRWSAPIALPDDVVIDPQSPPAMAVVGGRLMIAWRVADTVRVAAYAAGEWQAMAQFRSDDLAEFDVLDFGKGMLWIAGLTGPGTLYNLGDPSAAPIELEHPADLSQPTPRAVTTHSTSIRLFFVKSDGLAVQTYDPLGKRNSDLAVVPAPATPADPRVDQWLQILGMVAVLFVLFTTIRQRRQPQTQPPEPLKGVQLASFGTRLVAGLIDLAPILIFLGWVWTQANQQELVSTTRGQILAYLVSAIYLLHTTVVEAIFGRTIGKMFVGLKVVMADGSPAGVGPLVLRNVLRIIDLAFTFLPLLAIFYMPSRQRIGDIAAKTIVVEKAPSEPTSDDRDESNDQI